MPNKKDTSKEPLDTSISVSELDQLRQIVFGAASTKLSDQIALLRSDMEKALSTQQQKFSDNLASLKENVEQQFSEVENKLQFIDSSHDENEANLQKSIDSLASEHEMFATATQQDFKNIEEALGSESSSLSSNFNEQLEQLKSHLEDVSKELSSSKTDRKTLARLLATMATNLEDDQL